jgi:hypothetical protein
LLSRPEQRQVARKQIIAALGAFQAPPAALSIANHIIFIKMKGETLLDAGKLIGFHA